MTASRSIVLVGLLAIFAAGPAQAQVVLGGSAGAAMPTGDLSDILDTGFAVGGFVGTWLGESFLIKGDIGYHGFTSKEATFTVGGQTFTVEASGGVVPIRAGFYKYWGQSKRFYTGTSLGAYIPTGDLEGTNTNFGLGPRIGFLFPIGTGGGSIDLMAEYHTIFIGDNPLTDEDRVFFDSERLNYLIIGLGFQVSK